MLPDQEHLPHRLSSIVTITRLGYTLFSPPSLRFLTDMSYKTDPPQKCVVIIIFFFSGFGWFIFYLDLL